MRHRIVIAAAALAAWGPFLLPRSFAWEPQPAIFNPPVAVGVLFSPDNRFVLVGYSHSGSSGVYLSYRVFTIPGGQRLCELPGGFHGFGGGAAFLPNGRVLIAVESSHAPEDQRGLSLWDCTRGKQIGLLPWPGSYSPRAVAVSPDGKLALSGHVEGPLLLWDVAARKVIRKLDREHVQVSTDSIVSQARFVGGSRWALSLSGNQIKLWDVTTGRRLLGVEKAGHWFPQAVSPSGKLGALSALEDPHAGPPFGGPGPSNLVLWELASGKEVLRLKAPPALALAFTPDGRGLLSASSSRVIQRWDLASGKPLWSLPVDPPSVTATTAAGFSADGRLAVTAAGETVKLWDLTTRQFMRLLASQGGTKDELLLTLLAERARASDPGVRREAVEDLAKVGSMAFQLLVRALRDRTPEVRCAAARGLGAVARYDHAAAEAALRRALKDRDGLVQVEAALSLDVVHYSNQESLPRLRDALKDADYRVRLRAVEALGAISNSGACGRADPELALAFKDRRVEVRRKAVAMLDHNRVLGKELAPGLVATLKDADGGVRVRAAAALERIYLVSASGTWPPAEFPAEEIAVSLAGALRDQDLTVRRRATHLLWKVGPRAKPAAPALTLATRDPDATVRAHAAAALLRIDPKVPVARVLIDAMTDREARGFAVTAAAGLGPQAAPALVEVLIDDPAHRGTAADALSWLGKAAVPELVRTWKALRGADLLFHLGRKPVQEDTRLTLAGPFTAGRDRRLYIAHVLGRIGAAAEAATPTLAECATNLSDSPTARLEALRALAAIGREAAPAFPSVLPLREARDWALCYQARQTLWAIDPEAARKASVPKGAPPRGDMP